jgi:hypothetical protein
VESLFRSKSPDPWAPRLAGDLADFVIYADTARYALPLKDLSVPERNVALPSLLKDLKAGEPGLFRPERLLTDQCGEFNVHFLRPAARNLVSWGKANHRTLKKWTELHNESWIREPHGKRVPRRYAIAEAALKDNNELETLAKTASIPVEDVWYALDVILRYPVYGGIAGPENCYLNHPIRDAVPLPTKQEKIPQRNRRYRLASQSQGLHMNSPKSNM